MTGPLLAALLLLAAAPTAAAADDVSEARALFDQGAKLFHAGKYREAVGRFEAAYRLKPHGAIRFNVAQCHEKLGEWPAAVRSYQDYLRELPEARDRAAVRAAIVRIEQRLAAAGVQALLVYTDPPGAAVRLDGKVRGRTPFHITLAPGSYRVALSLDGFATEEQEVEVNAASSRLVEVVLRTQAPPAPAGTAAGSSMASQVPMAAAKVTPTPTATPTSAPTASSMAAHPERRAEGPESRETPDLSPRPPASPLSPVSPPGPTTRKPRVYTWVTAGAAVAAGAAGAWFGLEARKRQDALRDGAVHADADALARDARSKARTANLLYGLSGAAAAAGVTLFFVEGRF